MNLKQTTLLIVQWGHTKSILNNPEVTPIDQMRKTQEEMGELWVAVIIEDRANIIEEIGDVFVTLAIQAEMWGAPLDIKTPWPHDHSFSSPVVAMASLDPVISRLWLCLALWDKDREAIGTAIHLAIDALNTVAAVYGVSLDDCAFHAFKKIEGRTGEVINGQFVKDQ